MPFHNASAVHMHNHAAVFYGTVHAIHTSVGYKLHVNNNA